MIYLHSSPISSKVKAEGTYSSIFNCSSKTRHRNAFLTSLKVTVYCTSHNIRLFSDFNTITKQFLASLTPNTTLLPQISHKLITSTLYTYIFIENCSERISQPILYEICDRKTRQHER